VAAEREKAARALRTRSGLNPARAGVDADQLAAVVGFKSSALDRARREFLPAKWDSASSRAADFSFDKTSRSESLNGRG